MHYRGCEHRSINLYSCVRKGSRHELHGSRAAPFNQPREIRLFAENYLEWQRTIENADFSGDGISGDYADEYEKDKPSIGPHHGIHVRFLRSLRVINGEGVQLEYSGKNWLDLFRASFTQLRRKIVHDIVPLRDNAAGRTMDVVTNLLAKRSFVVLFFHGSKEDRAFVEHELGRNSTTTILNCETCVGGDTGSDGLAETVSKRRKIRLGNSNPEGDQPKEGELSTASRRRRSSNTSEHGRGEQLGEGGGELFGCRSYTAPHWHLIHDCAWNSNSCRCVKLNVRPRLRTHDTHKSEEETTRYFVSLLEYSNEGQRSCVLLQIGGAGNAWPKENSFTAATGRLCHPNKGLSYEGFYQIIADETLRASFSEYESSMQSKRSVMEPARQVRSGLDEDNERRQDRAKIIPTKIVKFAFHYATYPINAINQTQKWLNSPYKFVMASDQVFVRAMNNLMTQTSKWSIDDYIKLYTNNNSVWGAVNVPFDEYYYSVQQSAMILEDLIIFQMNAKDEDYDMRKLQIRDFLTEIYSVFERLVPKKNTIYVVSPPSAGKNYFFDAILTFYLNCGNVANYNKNNQFPFQDCINRRVLLWNEPNFMQSAVDTIKMLTGGDNMHVNVKYSNHVPLYRTPVLVLSNNHVFKDKAFTDRMYTYRWQTAPQLKQHLKKPHPLVWPYLLHNHKIHEITNTETYNLLFDINDDNVLDEGDSDNGSVVL